MGRCQSTPGLVESRGRVPLEEMWVSPIDLKSHAYSTVHSLFSPNPSPVTLRGIPGAGIIADANNVPRGTESPMSATSSGPSSEDQTARVPQSAATQPSTARQSTHSGKPAFPSSFGTCIVAQSIRDVCDVCDIPKTCVAPG